jgi:hypothetical protein
VSTVEAERFRLRSIPTLIAVEMQAGAVNPFVNESFLQK